MTEKKKPGSKNAKNKASTKKPARKKSGTTQKPVNSTVLKEAVGILLVTTGVLLLVCMLFNVDMGTFGASVNNFLGSLAGRGAIVIPFSVTVVGVLIFLDRYWGIKSMRFISLILFFLIIPAFAHMSVVFSDDLTIYLADAAAGGGQIGGRVSFMLRKAFGDIGTVLILISLSLVGLVLFTGRSLRAWIQAAGARIRPSFESLHPNMTEEEYLQKKEEEIIRRNELSKQKYQKRLDNKIERRLENQLDNRHAENGHTETAQATDTSLPIIIRHDDSIAIPPMDIKTPRRRIRAEDVSFVRDFMLSVDKDTDNQENSIKSEAASAAGVDDIQDISDPEQDSQNDDVSLTELIEYILPEPELMTAAVTVKNPNANKAIANTVSVLEETLESFGIKAKVTQVVAGPAITRYELQPAPGIKVSRIVSLSDDIAMSLAASDVRIEAPIPGKSAIGIEVPREETSTVFFREVIESPEFKNSPSKLTFGLGKDIAGKVIVGDLAKMPHLLVAGATGMGKSVCINSLICSILYKAKPSEVKFLFIDPKKVELSNYAGLPHLNSPVVTDAKKAAPTLKGVVNEMENRYDLFSSAGVRDFPGYNRLNPESPLYHIVVIIDELSDLMMLARDEIENNICRLTQMARAAGIHIVIATQRPSVDVITGLIKANVPSRIAFAVTSSTDSRTVLDMGGAEKLIGKGDMLYYPVGISKPIRVQGTYISEFDTQTLVDYCKAQASPNYNQAISDIQASADNPSLNSDMDSLFVEVVREVLRSGQASASYLQRRFKLGNPRAARIMDSLEENGIVGPSEGAKPRKILISAEEFERRFGLKQGNKDETERNG